MEESDSKSSEDDSVALLALHQPQLVKGIAASLRTLIIATFRAPPTQYVMNLLRYYYIYNYNKYTKYN